MKFLENYIKYKPGSDIERLCHRYGISNYIIRPDGLVDVDGNVRLNDLDLKELPVKFGIVTGDFICSSNSLIDLKGAPLEVGGGFNCSYNKLTSLSGGPDKVGEYFHAGNNMLISLQGSPSEVYGFNCSKNQLTSLEGCPDKVHSFFCINNKLTSLEGCPSEVGGDFHCGNNKLTSLSGSPNKIGGYFNCQKNKLTSLSGGPDEVGKLFSCTDNQLTSFLGGPSKVGDDYFCLDNKLTSLEGIGEFEGALFCAQNNVFTVVGNFIHTGLEFIELFNDTDIIQDDSVIYDRLVWFYEEIGEELPDLDIIKKYYKIIR